jgi:hypothetical protein
MTLHTFAAAWEHAPRGPCGKPALSLEWLGPSGGKASTATDIQPPARVPYASVEESDPALLRVCQAEPDDSRQCQASSVPRSLRKDLSYKRSGQKRNAAQMARDLS